MQPLGPYHGQYGYSGYNYYPPWPANQQHQWQGQPAARVTLYHLLGGQPVVFCDNRTGYPTEGRQEAAAAVNGCPYVVRALLDPRCNFSSITQAAADALGLPRRRLNGGGATDALGFNHPVDVITQSVRIDLLLNPHAIGISFAPELLLCVPATAAANTWELQLGQDFFLRHGVVQMHELSFFAHQDLLQQQQQPQPGVFVPYLMPRSGARPVEPGNFVISEDTWQEARAVAAQPAATWQQQSASTGDWQQQPATAPATSHGHPGLAAANPQQQQATAVTTWQQQEEAAAGPSEPRQQQQHIQQQLLKQLQSVRHELLELQNRCQRDLDETQDNYQQQWEDLEQRCQQQFQQMQQQWQQDWDNMKLYWQQIMQRRLDQWYEWKERWQSQVNDLKQELVQPQILLQQQWQQRIERLQQQVDGMQRELELMGSASRADAGVPESHAAQPQPTQQAEASPGRAGTAQLHSASQHQYQQQQQQQLGSLAASTAGPAPAEDHPAAAETAAGAAAQHQQQQQQQSGLQQPVVVRSGVVQVMSNFTQPQQQTTADDQLDDQHSFPQESGSQQQHQQQQEGANPTLEQGNAESNTTADPLGSDTSASLATEDIERYTAQIESQRLEEFIDQQLPDLMRLIEEADRLLALIQQQQGTATSTEQASASEGSAADGLESNLSHVRLSPQQLQEAIEQYGPALLAVLHAVRQRQRQQEQQQAEQGEQELHLAQAGGETIDAGDQQQQPLGQQQQLAIDQQQQPGQQQQQPGQQQQQPGQQQQQEEEEEEEEDGSEDPSEPFDTMLANAPIMSMEFLQNEPVPFARHSDPLAVEILGDSLLQQQLLPDPLRHLIRNEPVRFLYTMQEIHLFSPRYGIPESAAIVRSSSSSSTSPSRHVVRARFNPMSATSMTAGLAERLGLVCEAIEGVGGSTLTPQPIPLHVLVDPLEVCLMRNHDDVVLSWTAPLVFVVDARQGLFELQLGHDFCGLHGFELGWSQPGAVITRLPPPAGDGQELDWTLLVPYIAPRAGQELVLGSSTLLVSDETMQEAWDLVTARREAAAAAAELAADMAASRSSQAGSSSSSSSAWEVVPAAGSGVPHYHHQQQQQQVQESASPPAAGSHQLLSPPPQQQGQRQGQSPLRHLIGGEQVTFFRNPGDVFGPSMEGLLPQWAAILSSSGSSSSSTAGLVVRARYNPGCPTSITAAVADSLGLARVAVGGGGGAGWLMADVAVPLQVLVDPLEICLMRDHDDVALSWTAPVVFVVPGATFWELQLGFDFCRVNDVSSLIVSVPYIAPKSNQERSLGSSTFSVAQDTWQEALDLAVARESVRARRAAAAAATAADDTDSGGSSSSSAGQQQQAQQQQGAAAVAPHPQPPQLTPAEAGRRAAERVLSAVGQQPAGSSSSSNSSSPARGTAEWVDEWAPRQPANTRQQHHQQQGRRRGRGQRQQGGQGRAGRRQQQQTQQQQRERPAQNASPDAAGGVEPLPAGLEAKPWPHVVEHHVPADDYTCTICMDDMQETHEQAAATVIAEEQLPLFAQLRCRHTFCELCFRDYAAAVHMRGGSIRCPVCRQQVENE